MKSIILSADEVRATLAGRKSQLRRVVKPQPTPTPHGMNWRGYIGLDADDLARHCPYGQPGDLLAVKETWAARFEYDKCAPREIHETASLFYAADKEVESHPGHGRRRSAATMPQWASRITLEVLSVRVERLHDISDKDAMLEGCASSPEWQAFGVVAFQQRWDSTQQGKRHPWSSNPWVWCVEYKVVTK